MGVVIGSSIFVYNTSFITSKRKHIQSKHLTIYKKHSEISLGLVFWSVRLEDLDFLVERVLQVPGVVGGETESSRVLVGFDRLAQSLRVGFRVSLLHLYLYRRFTFLRFLCHFLIGLVRRGY